MENKFLIGQRVIVGNEIGVVHAGKTLTNERQEVDNEQFSGYVWVYLPSKGYASNYSVNNVKPLPNNQL